MTNSERSLAVIAVAEFGVLFACVVGYVSTKQMIWLYAAGAVVAVFFFLYLRMIVAIRREKAALARSGLGADATE